MHESSVSTYINPKKKGTYHYKSQFANWWYIRDGGLIVGAFSHIDSVFNTGASGSS